MPLCSEHEDPSRACSVPPPRPGGRGEGVFSPPETTGARVALLSIERPLKITSRCLISPVVTSRPGCRRLTSRVRKHSAPEARPSRMASKPGLLLHCPSHHQRAPFSPLSGHPDGPCCPLEPSRHAVRGPCVSGSRGGSQRARGRRLAAVGSAEMFFLQVDARPFWCPEMQVMPQDLFAAQSWHQQADPEVHEQAVPCCPAQVPETIRSASFLQ